MYRSSGFHEASGSYLFFFCSFFRLCLGVSFPPLPGLQLPAPPYFPAPGSSACHSISAFSTLGSKKGCIPSVSCIMVYSQRTAPESQAGFRATGLEGQARGSRLSSLVEADFLTLQGTVWSRAAGWGPVVPESSRSGWNQWVAQTFGKG